MKVVAGLDVGNSTTEVVLLTEGPHPEVVAHARAFTRGEKGSATSVAAAARLTLRLVRRHGVVLTAARVAPLRPVHTGCRTVSDPPPDTRPLHVLLRRAVTAAGDGAAVGRPVEVGSLTSVTPAEPVVALASAGEGYAAVADAVTRALAAGVDVVGVLLVRDEAVLVANRLPVTLPVLDQVPVEQARSARLVALEARPQGQPLTRLTDAFWLATALGVDGSGAAVRTVCRELEDSSFAVVSLDPHRTPPAEVPAATEQVEWCDGSTSPLAASVDRLAAASPGSAVALVTDGTPVAADDVYAVHLGPLAHGANARRGTVRTDRLVTAVLRRSAGDVDPTSMLREELGVEVHVAKSEVAAGRLGALSTPGAPWDAVVVDLGGGTIDVSSAERHCVVAGAGELLTRVVAEGVGIPSGTAEHAKRGPALQVVAPQVVLDEEGSRAFLDAPAPSSAAGALCVHGPAGLLPFQRELGLGDWRSWRLTAKARCLGDNVARALQVVVGDAGASLVLVGGAAGDDEVVTAVTRALAPGSTVGRGNVAGRLGHRGAVAYGLAAEGGL